MQEIYIVMTELNGYKNIYGKYAFQNKDNAEDQRLYAEQSGCYDEAYIVTLGLREPIDWLVDLRDSLQEELGRMDVFEFAKQQQQLEAKLGKPISQATWEEVMEASNDKA